MVVVVGWGRGWDDDEAARQVSRLDARGNKVPHDHKLSVISYGELFMHLAARHLELNCKWKARTHVHVCMSVCTCRQRAA